jgi:hypothetical protein
MKKIVRLTESDLVKIVKRVLQEQILPKPGENPEFDKVLNKVKDCCMKAGMKNFPTIECGPVILAVVMGQTPTDKQMEACNTAVKREAPNAVLECGTCIFQSVSMSGGKLPDMGKLPFPKFPYNKA